MAEEEEKPREKRFTREFVEKWTKTSEEEASPEEAILEKQLKLLEKDPKNVRVWFARGLLLHEMGRNEEALECLDKVTSLNPSYPGIWNARAEVLRKLGRDEEAAESLNKALEHVGVQVDDKFKEKMGRVEGIDELLELAEIGEGKVQEPPEEEEPPEEVSEVLEELETLGQGEPSEEEVSPEEREYRAKIDAWAAQGFDVSPLKNVLQNEPYKARTFFFQFEQNVAKIAVLKETLDGIKVPGFEEQVARLRDAMKAPMNIWRVEADMSRLLSRVETREKEIAREKAQPEISEAEPEAVAPARAPPRVSAPKVSKPASLKVAEGRVNGKTVVGRVNGLAAAGRVNGLVNGLQSARRGLTNGLTNGNGFTNGLGSRRFRREAMYRRWKLGLIPAVAAVLLMVSLFSAPISTLEGPWGDVTIDGNPAEWSGVSGYSQTQDVPVDNVNITEYKTLLKDDYLSFLVQVKGTALGDTNGLDSFYAFIDADGSKWTGYRLREIGADFMIEVSGRNGLVNISLLYAFLDANPGGNDNWTAWSGLGSIFGAASGNTLEFQVQTSRLTSSRFAFDPAKFEVYIFSDDNEGITSLTAAKMSGSYGALLVHQKGSPVTVSRGGVETLLTIVFEAVGSEVHVDQVQFVKSAKTEIFDAPANFDVVPGSPVTKFVNVSTQSTNSGDFLSLEVSGVDADRPATILGQIARAYVEAVPAEKRVDGIFVDWPSDDLALDSGATSPSSLDISHYASNKTATEAFFYLDVRGAIMAGTPVAQMREVSVPQQGAPSPSVTPKPLRGEDVLRVYLDSDSQDGEGLPVLGLPGADYLIEIRGMNGKISSKRLYQWASGRWQTQGGVPDAENDQKRIEIGLSLTGIAVNAMQVAFESSSWRKVVDTTDVGSVRGRTRGLDETKYEALYSVTMPNEISASKSIRFMAGSNYLEWNLPSEVLLMNGSDVHILAELSSSNLTGDGRLAFYADAYPAIGMDVEYLIEDTSLKERFVIKQPLDAANAGVDGNLRLTFVMKLDPSLMVYIDGCGPEDTVTTTKPISFTDGSQEKFTIPPAMTWDSSGRLEFLPYVWDTNGPTLSIDVPMSYLKESAYPVYIDPWINYTIKNSGPLATSTEQFGYSVAIGDFNNDGYADLLTGAPGNAKNYTTGGASYIYLGPLTSNKTTPNVNIPSPGASNRSGWAVAACKCNNDNYWDAVVTRWIPGQTLHRTAVYYGRASWPLWLTSANVTINNLGSGSPWFGYSVATGNIDGSFYDDIAIGAPGNTNVAAFDGAVFVFLSPFPSSVTSANFTLLPPTNATGRFGFIIAAGLIDSDSKYDIVIGEPFYNSNQGRVSFFKGSSLSSGSGNRMPDAYLTGRQSTENFGWSLAVGKLNSDSYEDVAVGAPANGLLGSKNGKVYLYLTDSNGISTGQTPNAEVLNQSNTEQFGTAVWIGPILGSGTYNLAVGAPFAAVGGSNRGAVYIFDSPLTSSTPTKIQTGNYDNDKFGFTLAGGRFANDNFYRLAVGNPNWVGGASAGRVVIMYIPEFLDTILVTTMVLLIGICFSRKKLVSRRKPNRSTRGGLGS